MDQPLAVPDAVQLDRYAEDFGALFAEYQDIRKQFDIALRGGPRAGEIQQGLEALLDGLADVGVVLTDCDGCIRAANPAAAGLLGPAAERGTALAHCVAESDRAAIGDLVVSLGQEPAELMLCSTAGRALRARALRVPDPERGHAIHWQLRLTEDAAVADSRADLVSLLHVRSANGIMVTDVRGTVLSVNRAFSEITGYDAADILGQPARLLSSGRHDQAFFARMWRDLAANGEWQGEIWNRRRNGEIYLEWLHIVAAGDDDGGLREYVAMFYDVGHAANAGDRLHELANHDTLTGLPNRAACRDRLQQAIARARRAGGEVGLLFIDIDGFREVNDTRGHAVGDQVLIDFSRRLVHAIRDGDTAARLGSDEFVVIVPGLAGEDAIRIVADKIFHSLAEPFDVDGRALHVGASVGAAVYPTHADDGDGLLRKADTAMHAAKRAGGNACHCVDDTREYLRARRQSFEACLHRALAQGEFRLAYQPQVAAAGGRLVGVEALLRWDRPGHGTVAPGAFIPLAEETGLILPIGEWVLRSACLQLAAWRRQGLPPVRMAVNVAARQINDAGFARRVIALLDETETPARQLEIEITESQLMDDLHAGLGNLAALREAGVAVVVDDFGTGYSCLGRIRVLPIDRIKIDRSFVADMHTNPDSRAVANAIVAMANAMRLGVIAEGVEHADQARLLAGIDCHEFQGYLYGRPQSPEMLAAMLDKSTGGTP